MKRVVGPSGLVLTVDDDTAAALLLDGSVELVKDEPVVAKKAAARPAKK